MVPRLGKMIPRVMTQAVIASCLLVALAASNTAFAAEEDPWEGFNRAMFSFNETFDRILFKPIAKGYDFLTPKPLDDGISNVFNNLGEVRNFVNDSLQGKWRSAGTDISRLLINTTLGVGGLVDVASRLDVEGSEEDFGQTLGSWDVGAGPYLVIPFLGPSSMRDFVARFPDGFLYPPFYINPDSTRIAVNATDIIDTRSDLMATERLIQGDRYTFIRDAYLQRREYLVTDGDVEDDFTSDDFDDDEDEEY